MSLLLLLSGAVDTAVNYDIWNPNRIKLRHAVEWLSAGLETWKVIWQSIELADDNEVALLAWQLDRIATSLKTTKNCLIEHQFTKPTILSVVGTKYKDSNNNVFK